MDDDDGVGVKKHTDATKRNMQTAIWWKENINGR